MIIPIVDYATVIATILTIIVGSYHIGRKVSGITDNIDDAKDSIEENQKTLEYLCDELDVIKNGHRSAHKDIEKINNEVNGGVSKSRSRCIVCGKGEMKYEIED